MLRRPTLADHKYRAGVVSLVTGSGQYPGAAVLGVGGALHSGAGMVRYWGPVAARRDVLSAHPEVVAAEGDCHATVVGSGWGEQQLELALKAWDLRVPTVIDAGALPHFIGWTASAGARVLTPHTGEAAKLGAALGVRQARTVRQCEAQPQAAALALAAATRSVVVLKGGVTWVAAPDGWSQSFTPPSAWGGVAGSGDVLSGVIGSLLAQRTAGGLSASLPMTVAVGVWLHGMAASWAAGVTGPGLPGHPIRAGEIAPMIPTVWGAVAQDGSRITINTAGA